MSKKTVRTGGQKMPGMPFMGEMMECTYCGKRQKSNPKVESNWTALEVGGRFTYICPECWYKYTGVKLT